MDLTSRREFLLAMAATPLLAASNDRRVELISEPWTAKWIAAPGAPPHEFGVYHFRRRLKLSERPQRFVVHVSGDNRYQLFVNGRRVVWGPARGDLAHWRFETVDAAPYLSAGDNVFAAVVWNFGQYAPEAQQTLQTGFVLQGDSKLEQAADTGPQWLCMQNPAYAPIFFSHGDLRGYFVAGPGEMVDGAKYVWGWEQPQFDDSNWQKALVVAPAAGADARDVHSRWMLVPREIPLMEEAPLRVQTVRKAAGPAVPASWPAQAAAFEIPPRTKAVYLLDQTQLTTGYPELEVSGGRGAQVKLRYAECLQIGGGRAKPNRNQVEGLDFIGYHDVFTADGGRGRVFRPLWWRTWRYIEMHVETQDDPLRIEDLRATFTAYPFGRKSRFDAGDAGLAQILDVGWHTARLCAHETYMDCPYYEQLQYVGDTRIQALISVFNSGDTRLMKNAIAQINDSRNASGATMSRYPTRLQQYIPAFSLWWIGMVHDYWRYVDDPGFVRAMLPGVRSVLSFFESHQKENGSLGTLPWWRFMDWADEWKGGDAPQEKDGSSASFDMLLAMGYEWASELEAAQGMQPLAGVYRNRAAALRAIARQLYWDEGRHYYADTPAKQSWSQQANTLAVLSGTAAAPEARDLLVRTLEDRKLIQCSLFFRHYLYTAMNQVGEGDRYIDQLADWHAMLANGLTTFSEVLDAPGRRSRSDCHAWSASPNYELLHTLLGVDSAGPHFRRVVVRPFLGRLAKVSGSVPHPKGAIEVTLERSGAGLRASIATPVPGEFVWAGKRFALKPGRNEVKA